MTHSDFHIGLEFFTSAGLAWRCTDVGTRIIAAIRIEAGRGGDWCSGPPYAVEEIVFDENDFPGCYRTAAAAATDQASSLGGKAGDDSRRSK